MGPTQSSEALAGKIFGQISVTASREEEAGSGDPWAQLPTLWTSGQGPQCQDTQRGPFPALQLAVLLLARQSMPLSPAHAGRMKEN